MRGADPHRGAHGLPVSDLSLEDRGEVFLMGPFLIPREDREVFPDPSDRGRIQRSVRYATFEKICSVDEDAEHNAEAGTRPRAVGHESWCCPTTRSALLHTDTPLKCEAPDYLVPVRFAWPTFAQRAS